MAEEQGTKSIESLVKKAYLVIDCYSEQLHRLSLDIWERPELGYEEVFAHQVLTNFLEKHGFSVSRSHVLPTAFRATFGDRNTTGPTVAVLCEYDALPELGHGCGHNLIAEAGIAAAIGIKSAIEENPGLGQLVVLGTPAEEGNGGKIDLINGGCFKDIDFCLMVHPAHMNVAFYNSMSNEEVIVTYRGHASHAAAFPWEGINALDAAVSAYTSVSLLRQQMKPTWRVHGIFTEAGSRPNVIPEQAQLHYYLRATTNADHAILKTRMLNCFNAAATATGCDVYISWKPSYFACMLTNDTLAKLYQESAEELGMLFPSREDQEALIDGSTDMGNVSLVVPGIEPLYTIDEKALYHSHAFKKAAGTIEAHKKTILAGKALVKTALAVMIDPELMKIVKDEFRIKGLVPK